jgi:hypothetical protein
MSLSRQENFNKMKFNRYSNAICSRNSTPYKWSLNEHHEDIFEYLISIIKDQIIFDGFSKKSIEFLDLRAKIVNQIIQICDNFKLRNETLFKTVQIFDMYCWKISNFQNFLKIEIENFDHPNENENDPLTLIKMLKELKIIIVICLNIACKQEEINCNYISYLKEHLLDDPEKNEIYDLKTLIKKEIEIMKVINFRIAAPSIYVFINVLIEFIIMEYFRKNPKIDASDLQNFITHFVRLNDVIIKVYCTLHESVFISPLYSALICIKATLIQFENLYQNNLFNMDKFLTNLIDSTSYEIEYEFVDRVSNRLFSLIKSKNLRLNSC